jgi:hypothetical protein
VGALALPLSLDRLFLQIFDESLAIDLIAVTPAENEKYRILALAKLGHHISRQPQASQPLIKGHFA